MMLGRQQLLSRVAPCCYLNNNTLQKCCNSQCTLRALVCSSLYNNNITGNMPREWSIMAALQNLWVQQLLMLYVHINRCDYLVIKQTHAILGDISLGVPVGMPRP